MKSSTLPSFALSIGVIWIIAFAPKAAATTFFEQAFVCPIGGEEFTAAVVGSNTTFGSRPDGRPYSPLPVYPITECPGNGFLIFQDEWTDEELAILEAAVETREYQQMRAEETPYYRLWWLAGQVDAPAHILARHLMVASWETDGNIARKTRYQQAFADAVASLDRTAETGNWFWLSLRAANARRELGQFEAAETEFAAVEQSLPAISEEREREYTVEFLTVQRQLIAEGNAASEPVTLVPAMSAIFRCVLAGNDLTESEVQACQSDDVQEAIAGYTARTSDGARLSGVEAIRHVAARNQNNH
ncbi:hypothetical protein [Parasphingopyxis marina]|uniref:Uncharacterized protein n=1 Tax=Parasphingopyxis marina TaxID=2761622 RepID=A0A842HXJ8_9SPHN|nr:hypothetical protein [Parasphingopyxis marina]MBC2776234.1 hypothetical protein [Parasphingopyxis marina]